MSGDVQPRKRKDKKKKKDDLGIEEPRGTAAALGEGDIFMHSYHEHGTGGHWCAKVIFFSLLAVLVTLIGLIILENRGLSELEANSVESRYSGVLEGWLEDGHDDDHHDEHTLELKHDDEDDDEHSDELGHDHDDEDDVDHDDNDHDEDDEEQSDEANDDDDDDETRNDDGDQEEENSNEENLETAEDEDEVEEKSFRRYYRSTENQLKDDHDDDDDDDNDDLDHKDDEDQSAENEVDDEQQNDSQEIDDELDDDNDNNQENDDDDEQDDDNKNSQENDDEDEQDEFNTNDDDNEKNNQDEEDEDHDDHNDHEEDPEVELEHIEEEVFDDDVSTEAPTRREPEESEEVSKEAGPVADDDDDDVEQLEPDDIDDLPDELPIPVPKGKPLVEVEYSPSTEKPHDTLAEEEEYERQQEALRKEKEEASQGMWLKLVVGGALLVATQAVLRRATAPRESEEEVDTTREDTPVSDRRMTLIADPVPPPATPKSQEVSRPVIEKEVVKQAPVVKSVPSPPPEEDEEEEEVDLEEEEDEEVVVEKDEKGAVEKDKELYSDEEEEAEDEEEEEVEQKLEPPKTFAKPSTPTREPPKPSAPIKEPPKSPAKETPEKKEPPKVVEKEPTPEEEEDDDVEIIEEEDIGEDLEEEEEEISDVDDVELLNRLEAKYGRLPDPDRPGRQKDGGNSIEDEWPGEPSDAYWRDELDQADQDLRQGEWTTAAKRASAAELRSSARARYIVARAYDMLAEAKRDNALLTKAIAAYLELLKMNEKLSNKKLLEITDRTLDRMKFRGSYLSTEPIYRLLIRRFPNDPTHRNNLSISFLMANRMDLAEEVIKETLKQWPDDRIALANHGFILKTLHKDYEGAVEAFSKALEGDTGPTNEPRYYYHLGDSLLLLGRHKEAHEVHKRGAKLGHFLSPAQRSLYNVNRLKSQPWWNVEKTPYARLARALEKSWKEILKEGRAAQAMYEEEKEGLREKGEWSQLDLFARGREVGGRCARAPVTCGIVRAEPAASGCRRGQVKFSLMEAGTHVRPHVGPTNCRLRMHLGLSNTKDTYIRVDQEIRQWQTGKVLMFDDSFEHEVWHNGTGARLVLIVDVWHPDLTRTEINQLPSI